MICKSACVGVGRLGIVALFVLPGGAVDGAPVVLAGSQLELITLHEGWVYYSLSYATT